MVSGGQATSPPPVLFPGGVGVGDGAASWVSVGGIVADQSAAVFGGLLLFPGGVGIGDGACVVSD